MTNPLGFDKWEYHLRNSDWHVVELISEEISNTTLTCMSDMRFQIVHYAESLESTTFGDWSKGLPDPACHSCFVDLRISGATIDRFEFAYLDGFRYLVPIPNLVTPDMNVSPETNEYYYDSNSIEFLVGEVIGRFNVFGGLEEFTHRQGIAIR